MSDSGREFESVDAFFKLGCAARGVFYFFYCFDGDFYYRGGVGLGSVNSFMRFKRFDWGSRVIVYVRRRLFIFLLFLCAGIYSTFLSGVGLIADLFVVDMVSLYLALLSCLLWVSLWFWFEGLRGLVRVMISLRVVCSLLCYCCVHSV